MGIDHILNSVVEKLGEVEKVFLAGELARGMDSKIVDLVIIGKIDRSYLQKLCEKAEKLVNRNIRSLVLEQEGLLKDYPTLNSEELLLIWSQETAKDSGE
jgi:AAA+ ATPase superfamily predicted ATPase